MAEPSRQEATSQIWKKNILGSEDSYHKNIRQTKHESIKSGHICFFLFNAAKLKCYFDRIKFKENPRKDPERIIFVFAVLFHERED